MNALLEFQDVQKGLPARPQRENSRGVLFLGTSQAGSDARTKLEAFFNIRQGSTITST